MSSRTAPYSVVLGRTCASVPETFRRAANHTSGCNFWQVIEAPLGSLHLHYLALMELERVTRPGIGLREEAA
jgi:hypothetical protein